MIEPKPVIRAVEIVMYRSAGEVFASQTSFALAPDSLCQPLFQGLFCHVEAALRLAARGPKAGL